MIIGAEATEVGPDSGCGTEARRTLAGQLSSLELVPLCVGTERLDDAVELAEARSSLTSPRRKSGRWVLRPSSRTASTSERYSSDLWT